MWGRFHGDMIDREMIMFDVTEHLVKSLRDAGRPRSHARQVIMAATSVERWAVRQVLFEMLWPVP